MKDRLKQVIDIHRETETHWVGDGFPVSSLFSYHRMGAAMSPFLLLDHAGPAEFSPAERPRGVGEHPHRGFETVTIVYQGEVEHRDSSGGGGKIGPGEVQWMTAASGIVHEEFHGQDFTRRGGVLHMAQLWVNLPAKHKMDAPRYQDIRKDEIPEVTLPNDAGMVRIVAGEFEGKTGPAKTYTPMQVWDVRLRAGQSANFSLPDGHTTALAVMAGIVQVNGSEELRNSDVVRLERAGTAVNIDCKENAIILLLSGEPIDEPIVGQGPFVMNTKEEIFQAARDYQSGKMGHLPS